MTIQSFLIDDNRTLKNLIVWVLVHGLEYCVSSLWDEFKTDYTIEEVRAELLRVIAIAVIVPLQKGN
jgi:hypothetical protein